jgi:aldehyde dehydrogenase (NAD+)
MKRVTVELGGKSPNIVFADADLDKAVPAAAMAVFANAGQICSAGTRLFVQRSIHDEFMARLADFTRTIRVGDPLDPATQIGPVVSGPQMDKILGFIEGPAGRRAGAGGRRAHGRRGAGERLFIETIFTGVTDEMTIAREEIFGPVLSAFAFDTEEEVLKRANATPFGLGSGVGRAIWHGASHGAGHSGRVGLGQLLSDARPRRALRRLQAERFRARSGPHHIEDYLETKAVWINLD